MNFDYFIILNYHFPLDRLDVYILYLMLAEGPRGGCPLAPPPGCTTASSRQHPDVLVNIEDSKIASEFISFRDDVASSMELLSDF